MISVEVLIIRGVTNLPKLFGPILQKASLRPVQNSRWLPQICSGKVYCDLKIRKFSNFLQQLAIAGRSLVWTSLYSAKMMRDKWRLECPETFLEHEWRLLVQDTVKGTSFDLVFALRSRCLLLQRHHRHQLRDVFRQHFVDLKYEFTFELSQFFILALMKKLKRCFPASFLFLSFQYSSQWMFNIKFCQRLDSNRGPL